MSQPCNKINNKIHFVNESDNNHISSELMKSLNLDTDDIYLVRDLQIVSIEATKQFIPVLLFIFVVL